MQVVGTRMIRAAAFASVLGAAVVMVGGVPSRAADSAIVIRQSQRTFLPHQASVPRGTAMSFVNDEAVTHHAFVDTPGFAADSDDIPPGGAAVLVFDRAGRFTVRCAIHPQMSLVVDVAP